MRLPAVDQEKRMDDSSLADRQRVLRVPADRPDLVEAARQGGGAVDDGAAAEATDTADGDVTVARVGPTGIAGLAPLVSATSGGGTAFYANADPDLVSEIAADLVEGSVGVVGEPLAVAGHALGSATFPSVPTTPLDVGNRRILDGAGWHRPTDPADYEAAGGFVDAGLEAVVDAVDGLRGRGWGDWCHDADVAPALDRARDAFGEAAVVVNAHGIAADAGHSGTGTHRSADAFLVESVPFAVLEGADLLATAVDAERVVIYVSEADETAIERARVAAENYPDPVTPFEVVTGPAVHRATEPTMALEAVEGNHRLEARLRRSGELPTLNGAPALVHTARTVAQLAERVQDSDGDGPGHPATRLVTVAGDVEAPATVELSETATLDAALGAVSVSGAFRAAAVGGRFGGLTDSLAVGCGPDALAEADLGTDGRIEILGEGRCLVEFAGRRAQLAADTNCGRCVPCREGSTQLTDLLRDVYDGDYDEDGIAELLRVMDESSVCAFGVEAARPARTAMDTFGKEFEAHADGRCPAGACFEPAEVTQ
jgi:NADH-quinone oxidoreductase subunit F